MVQPEVMGQKVEPAALADRSLETAAMEGLVATVAMVEQPATGAWGVPVVLHQEVARWGRVEHSALAARWAMEAMAPSAELASSVDPVDPVALAVTGSTAAMVATAGPAAPGWTGSSRLE
jgi:hypothetical protein